MVISLVTKKMQIETIIRYHFIRMRMILNKMTTGDKMNELELSYDIGGSVKMVQPLWSVVYKKIECTCISSKSYT